MKRNSVARCGFLEKAFIATALAISVPFLSSAQNSEAHLATQEPKTLSFKIAQSVKPDGEVAYYDEAVHAVTYYDGGAYDQNALKEINSLLRDRQQDVVPDQGIDKRLVDLLYEIKVREEKLHPGLNVIFHVISGYRSPTTNEDLRTDPSNPYRGAVSKGSMHTHAKAIDIFVPEIAGEELRNTAWCIGKGGVGWYPQFKKLFPYEYTHVDAGRFRTWGFNTQAIHCPGVH